MSVRYFFAGAFRCAAMYACSSSLAILFLRFMRALFVDAVGVCGCALPQKNPRHDSCFFPRGLPVPHELGCILNTPDGASLLLWACIASFRLSLRLLQANVVYAFVSSKCFKDLFNCVCWKIWLSTRLFQYFLVCAVRKFQSKPFFVCTKASSICRNHSLSVLLLKTACAFVSTVRSTRACVEGMCCL